MLIKRTKGWELPERQATPESRYLRRRELVAAMGLGAATIGLPGLAAAQDADPSAGRYPAPAQRQVRRARADHRRTAGHHLQQLLRVRHRQEHLARRPEARGPAVDHQGERQGRQAVRDRHRRPFGQDAARGTRLPPSLRRNLVDGRAVVGLPAALAGRVLQANRRRQVHRHADGLQPQGHAGPEGHPLSLALHRGAGDRRGDARSRLHRHRPLWQADPQAERRAAAARGAVEVWLQERQGDRQHRVHREASDLVLGEAAPTTSTASGPT